LKGESKGVERVLSFTHTPTRNPNTQNQTKAPVLHTNLAEKRRVLVDTSKVCCVPALV
jgi:hypothetical protein